jgi:hypothetical protein
MAEALAVGEPPDLCPDDALAYEAVVKRHTSRGKDVATILASWETNRAWSAELASWRTCTRSAEYKGSSASRVSAGSERMKCIVSHCHSAGGADAAGGGCCDWGWL